jgi:hypothetical protein
MTMDAFDVNLLSQVKALNQKMSISQEQLHLKRKAINEDKGKGKYPGRKPARDHGRHDVEYQATSVVEEKESTIDITI